MKIQTMACCFFLVVGTIAISMVIGAQMISNLQIIYAQNNAAGSLNKSLEKVWETPNQLKDPESVAYDSSKSTLYVSNVDGKPDDKDHTGFISKLSSTNGSIIDLNWVPNLNAPKGTDLDNSTGKLYVSDITELIEINSSSGKIINHYPASENSSLNDVAVDKNGDVFVSDPPNNAIYRLSTDNPGSNKSLHMWIKSPELNGPNGIIINYGKNYLVVASMGKGTPEAGGTIKAIDLEKKTIINIGKEGKTVPVGILDGLQMSGDGKSYYVSDWNAKNIFVVDTSGKGYQQLFNSPMQGMADFRLIGPEGDLVIPLMPDNKVTALRMDAN